MKKVSSFLFVFAFLLSNLIHSQTTYYTAHSGAWNDITAWSTVGIDSASCACGPGCNSLSGVVYIGNTMVSANCLGGIGPNAAITVNSGDTLTISLSQSMGGKMPVISSTINILSGGTMIINGELDITAGDTINNAGVLTVNGNVTDTNSGAYLAGGGTFVANGIVSGSTIFTNPQLWKAVQDTTTDSAKTNIVYTAGNVGIGTLNPVKPLEVKGDAMIDDTLIVPVIQAHRIALFPGDSLVKIGDSSIVLDLNNNNIYGERPCMTCITCPPCVGVYSSIALGTNNNVLGSSSNPINFSCAVGANNLINQWYDVVIGNGNIAGGVSNITIGQGLNNSITGSIMMGGYNNTGSIPAISIIPDMINGSAGFVGIGQIGTSNGALSVSGTASNYAAIICEADPTNAYSIMSAIPTSAPPTIIGLGVHILSSSPHDVFDVYGNGNIYAAGKVGIGNASPAYQLDVNGTIHATGDPAWVWTSSTGSPYPPATSNANAGWLVPILIPNGSAIRTSSTGSATYSDGGTGRYLGFGMVDNDADVNTTGWYWIIQKDPSAEASACYPMTLIMDRNGNATLTVSQNGWKDYIFEPYYKRMTIEEKELFYKQNKHLPGIDPASVVEKTGLNINKNISGMLQNIEEDRLDITQLYKIIQQQQKEIEELKDKINQSQK